MNRTNTVLAVLLVLVVVMTAAVGVDYSKPNIEILPDMKYTPAWEAFSRNPNFTDGMTMQAPVPGTIARGQLPLYYEATKEDAARAGEELTNPVSRDSIEAVVEVELEGASASAPAPVASGTVADDGDNTRRAAAIASERFAASIERGSEVYSTLCISCHGPKGAGDGPVTQRGFPPPPSMLTGKSLQMKDGQLFHIITYGQGSMAPFAGQVSRDLRWDVINYIRDLQSKAPAAPQPIADSAPSDAANSPEAASEKPANTEKVEDTEPKKDVAAESDAATQEPPSDEPTKAPKEADAKPAEPTEPQGPANELRDSNDDAADKGGTAQPETPATKQESNTDGES